MGSIPSRRVRQLPEKPGPINVDRSHFVLNVRVAARMVHWRSMDQNTKDILEAVNFIKEKVEQLPTKDDVRAIVEEVVE